MRFKSRPSIVTLKAGTLAAVLQTHHYTELVFGLVGSESVYCDWARQQVWYRLVGLLVKASTLRAEDPGGSNPVCAEIFSGSSPTSDLKKWHFSGYPARRLVLQGQCWLARCQYTVTG